MDHLSSLPLEIVQLVIEHLEYASEVNSLAQTSRHLCKIATSPFLYPQYARLCSPHGLDRLVANGNADSLRRLVANGVDLKKYLEYGRFLREKSDRRWPVEVAASGGFADVLQVFRDVCGPDIVRPGDLNIAINKGDLDVLKPFFHGGVPDEVKKSLLKEYIEHTATRGSVASMKCMIDGGLDVNSFSERRLTPLMMAAKGAHLDMTEFLLEAGADPNPEKFSRGSYQVANTPLYYAATAHTKRSSEAVVRCLLNHGARLVEPKHGACFSSGRPIPESLRRPPSLSSYWGEPRPKVSKEAKELAALNKVIANETRALAHLVVCGAEDIAQLIMTQSDFEARLASSDSRDRGYILIFAAGIGDEDLTRRLLKIDSLSVQMSPSPIQEAAKRGNSDILKLLLDKVAEEFPRYMNEVYVMAVSSAVDSNRKSTLAMILDHGGEDVLSLVVNRLHAEKFLLRNQLISSILVERGILKLFVEGDSLNATLQTAMKDGNYKFMTQIMRHFNLSPSFYLKRRRGSLLEFAAEYGPVEVFKEIVSLSVDIENDDIARSALFRAANGLQTLIIQDLLDRGLSVNTTTITTTTGPDGSRESTEPLIVRVVGSDTPFPKHSIRAQSTIRLLLERDVEIDAVTSRGETALLKAISRNKIDIAKQLLIAGANPFLKTGFRQNPLELAFKKHRCELVKIFLDVASARGYQHEDFLSLIPSQNIDDSLWEDARCPHFYAPSRTPESEQGRISQRYKWQRGEGSWADTKRRIEGSDDFLQYPIYWERFFMIKEMKKYYWRTKYPITQDAE
ncbi:ankyrin repeat-containing domain protein [Penicillium manginii]|uniref:ankyrin repeat-containing domain protein n=1 Tax=Penicillium manginii TaxID=203109 RepID=UPI00254748F0|nr:ankyrin repeat-containing domain protein [Penicillium manginii]KAJ5761508.1 ankyrin repeat-containing domain protein [Penicillium manginii]